MTSHFTSIIILTRNGLHLTKACVESIQKYTPEPYELIFIDNGSTDETVNWLRTLSGDIVVIENGENLGFGAGCNQGIARSKGDRILFLNNDTVVTPNWLTSMHKALDSDHNVGAVGPRSNYVAGNQIVENVGYDTATLDGLNTWSESWCYTHKNMRSNETRLIGFCLLVKFEVLELIGGFDLRFGLGNFEDDDICMRINVAGYKLQIVNDSFIHHVGNATFNNENIDYRESMQDAYNKFVNKWSITQNEIVGEGKGYRADLIVERSIFNKKIHYSPLISIAHTDKFLTLTAEHETIVGVLPDRLNLDTTTILLRRVLTFYSGKDISLLIRVDVRDNFTYSILESIADDLGDDNLPDITVIEDKDNNDIAIADTCTALIAYGGYRRGIESLAKYSNITLINLEDLIDK